MPVGFAQRDEVEVAKLFFELPKLSIQAVIFFATAGAILAKGDTSTFSGFFAFLAYAPPVGYLVGVVLTAVLFTLTINFFSEIVRAARGIRIEAEADVAFPVQMTKIIESRYDTYISVARWTINFWIGFIAFIVIF